MKRENIILFIVSAALILSSCASKRPVLYPNDHLMHVGDAVARQDIAECMRFASEHRAQQQRGGKIASDTAESAVIGGASGAAVGAIVNDVGKGAAAGAAGAGAATLTRGIFRSREPEPVYRNFVERCLRDRGYEPIGWR